MHTWGKLPFTWPLRLPYHFILLSPSRAPGRNAFLHCLFPFLQGYPVSLSFFYPQWNSECPSPHCNHDGLSACPAHTHLHTLLCELRKEIRLQATPLRSKGMSLTILNALCSAHWFSISPFPLDCVLFSGWDASPTSQSSSWGLSSPAECLGSSHSTHWSHQWPLSFHSPSLWRLLGNTNAYGKWFVLCNPDWHTYLNQSLPTEWWLEFTALPKACQSCRV